MKNRIMFSYFKVTDPVMDEFRLTLIDGHWNKQETVNAQTMRHDVEQLKKLPKEEQLYILQILSFFATGDDEVIDIIYNKLMPQIKCASWRGYEIVKQENEHIHSETYAGLIDFLAPEIKEELLEGTGSFEFVLDKLKWCRKYLEQNGSLERTLLCLILVEQLFFSSSFCSIFWYKNVREILPGVSISNELISRDEGHHYRAGRYLFNKYRTSLTNPEIAEIIKEAVDIEKSFVRTITPTTTGMSPGLLCTYVEFVADNIYRDLCGDVLYGAKCPFDFMLQFGVERKIDNFMRKGTGYSSFVVEEFVEKKY